MTARLTLERRAAFTQLNADSFLSQLDRSLEVLHDRGVVNETALAEVCEALLLGMPLSRDHLVAIFGVGPIAQLLTTREQRSR